MLYSNSDESMLIYEEATEINVYNKFMFIRMLYFGYESYDPTRAEEAK